MMPLDPDTRDYAKQIIGAFQRVGDALMELAREQKRANDIAERRINADTDNLDCVAQALDGIADAVAERTPTPLSFGKTEPAFPDPAETANTNTENGCFRNGENQ